MPDGHVAHVHDGSRGGFCIFEQPRLAVLISRRELQHFEEDAIVDLREKLEIAWSYERFCNGNDGLPRPDRDWL